MSFSKFLSLLWYWYAHRSFAQESITFSMKRNQTTDHPETQMHLNCKFTEMRIQAWSPVIATLPPLKIKKSVLLLRTSCIYDLYVTHQKKKKERETEQGKIFHCLYAFYTHTVRLDWSFITVVSQCLLHCLVRVESFSAIFPYRAFSWKSRA